MAVDETFFVVGGLSEWDISSVSGMILVTVVFGGIHCIAWSFPFPSPTEQLLWRVSSITITGHPIGIRRHLLYPRPAPSQQPSRSHPLHHPSTPFLYPVSRIMLLVLSLTTLRSLPPSAYQTVQWTTFLPHV